MSTRQRIEEFWNRIDYYEGGSLQLDLNHQLEWHISYISKTQKAIIIVTGMYPKGMDSSKSIAVAIVGRKDGRYNVTIALTEKNQEEVFISMCADLIDSSSDALSEEEALRKVVHRYKQWRRLMEQKRNQLLSVEQQKGLIGELLYLKEVLKGGMDNHEAILGWVGPDGADQDFVYNKQWHEVKTTGLASCKIEISSVEQLGDENTCGELIIQRVDKCAPEADGAFSLNDIVKELVSVFGKDGGDLDLFVIRLNNVGYIELPDYDEYQFCYLRKDRYRIDGEFPRITRESLRTEIINCIYQLDLPSIELWHKDGNN